MADSSINVTEGSGKRLQTYDVTVASVLVQRQAVVLGEQPLATYVIQTGTPPSTATGTSHLLEIMAGSSLNVYVRAVRVYQVGLATTAAIAQLQLVTLSSAGTGGTVANPAAIAGGAAPGATGMTLPTGKGTEGSIIGNRSAMFIQTVPTGGPGQATLLAEWDFDRPRTQPIRIAAGTSNGICVKNPSAVAGATVLIEALISEANF